MGDLDCVLDAMTDAGLEVCFSRIAAKPGAPMTFAREQDKAVFGLPGNPVTAYLMFHLFVLRAAARLSGTGLLIREFACRLGCDFERRKTDRVEYVPCRLRTDGHLEPVVFHGSAHLAALLEADGFFIVPAGKPRIEAGEPVAFLPTAGRMGERFKRLEGEDLG
jgi:molybdopterin molybdotransferase